MNLRMLRSNEKMKQRIEEKKVPWRHDVLQKKNIISYD